MSMLPVPARILGTMMMLCASTSYAMNISLTADDWQVLGYGRIPVNEVRFDDDGMQVSVDRSASAIVCPLETIGRFQRLHIDADITGSVDLGGKPQGSKGADDFRLRVGLVYAGDKTLNFLQRSIAPKWIKTLYALAPEGAGISRVEFYNTWQDPDLDGLERPHPTTDIWREHFVLQTDENGRIEQSVAVPSDADVVAIWISTDGDDTDSSFRVQINSLMLDPV